MENIDTRFRHLIDYQNWLEDGLFAVEVSLARYRNQTDLIRQARLISSIALLTAYQDLQSNYNIKRHAVNKVIDSCTTVAREPLV